MLGTFEKRKLKWLRNDEVRILKELFMEEAFITAIASILISIFTYIQFYRSEKRQREEFLKSQTRTVTQKLIDLRLEYYPKAFEITDAIIKTEGNNFDPNKIREAKENLYHWKSGIVRLIISERSFKYLYELRQNLSKNPGNGDSYTVNQVEKIWKSRNDFRNSLRSDIGILHLEDENPI